MYWHADYIRQASSEAQAGGFWPATIQEIPTPTPVHAYLPQALTAKARAKQKADDVQGSAASDSAAASGEADMASPQQVQQAQQPERSARSQ